MQQHKPPDFNMTEILCTESLNFHKPVHHPL